MRYIIICLLLVACQDFDQTYEYRIDSRLKIHVDQFFIEAAARGVKLRKERLLVHIEPQANIHGAGQSWNYNGQRIVLIGDDTYEFMNNRQYVPSQDSAFFGLESIVFHELGHALLRRGHCDPCYSIMNSGISYFVYANDLKLRSELLDELFTN